MLITGVVFSILEIHKGVAEVIGGGSMTDGVAVWGNLQVGARGRANRENSNGN